MRNAFVLDCQHGRRDVTCKPAILAVFSGLKILHETGERGRRTGNRKNEKWDMVRFFPSSRSSVIVPSSPFSLLQFGNIVGRRSRRKQKRREKEEGREISRIVLSSEAVVWLF